MVQPGTLHSMFNDWSGYGRSGFAIQQVGGTALDGQGGWMRCPNMGGDCMKDRESETVDLLLRAMGSYNRFSRRKYIAEHGLFAYLALRLRWLMGKD